MDEFGNLRSVSGEAFDVQLDPYSVGTVTDLADGTYKVVMSPTASGTYGITVALAGEGTPLHPPTPSYTLCTPLNPAPCTLHPEP